MQCRDEVYENLSYVGGRLGIAGVAHQNGTIAVRHRPDDLGARPRLQAARARQRLRRRLELLRLQHRGEPDADHHRQRAARRRDRRGPARRQHPRRAGRPARLPQQAADAAAPLLSLPDGLPMTTTAVRWRPGRRLHVVRRRVRGRARCATRCWRRSRRRGPRGTGLRRRRRTPSTSPPCRGGDGRPASRCRSSTSRLALDGLRYPLEPERVSVVRPQADAANGMTLAPTASLLVCEQGSWSSPRAISRVDRAHRLRGR